MKFSRVAVFALMLVLLPFVAAAQGERPVLTWMVLDLPPGSKPVNGELTDGINDVMLKLVFAEIPEFRHQIMVVNTARAMSNLSEGVQACFGSAAYSEERERLAYFTLAYLVPPLQVVARSDIAARLPRNELGEVVPGTLFNSPDLRGLVVPQRSYSNALDELLVGRSTSSGLRNVLATDGGANILRMLKLGRGDYTLEYDFVVNHLLGRTPELRGAANEFTLLPMAGAQPFPVGMACPHTTWGRQMIERIDAALTRIASQPAYREALLHWMTPDSAKRFNRALTDFMIQRAKPASQGKYPTWPSAR
jgi:uncharacterized protein (TIGR02285 family)